MRGAPPGGVLRQNRRGAVAGLSFAKTGAAPLFGHYRERSGVDRPDDRAGCQANC